MKPPTPTPPHELFEAFQESEVLRDRARSEFLTAMGWTYGSDNPAFLPLWSKSVRGQLVCVEVDAAVEMAEALIPWPNKSRATHPEGWTGPCWCDQCEHTRRVQTSSRPATVQESLFQNAKRSE